MKQTAKMIEQTKAYEILKGSRGRSPSDIGSIADALVRQAQLSMDFPEIEELDKIPYLCSMRDREVWLEMPG